MAKSINKEEPIILLGAGLAGSLMALYLARRGFKVEVYERRPDMRQANISAGRSINLAISARGLHAMEEVGLEDEVRTMCIPMRGRVIHDLKGNTEFQPYSKDGQTAINSISRGDLNRLLMDEADKFDGIRFHFNMRCTGVDMRSGIVHVEDERNHNSHQVTGQTVIATDGAYSGARYSMMKTPRFNYSQSFLSHSYKELSFPPTEDGGYLIEKNALHIWPRGHFMLIALPNTDGSFTVTLFYPHEGEGSFESLDTAAKARTFFQTEFPDALALMTDLDTEYFENPVGSLVTLKCDPWYHEEHCVLVGDSAHAIVPFYGQGMNAAFEDCSVFNDCLDHHATWKDLFEHYNELRVENGHAIADMALDNYIEMRDRVDDKDWKFRKNIEHMLEREYPGRYISRYEMVSFTRRPYAEAMERGILNDKILRQLAAGITTVEEVDLKLAERLMDEILPGQ
ncbi:UNVERIFIED_CONTAM: hypothetical protein GTU68_012507 [Idotea baltica]|nr:hypothetical protein [Idotea baltica]